MSSKTLGFYLVVFWALCVAGSGMLIRRQALAHDGGAFASAALAVRFDFGCWHMQVIAKADQMQIEPFGRDGDRQIYRGGANRRLR